MEEEEEEAAVVVEDVEVSEDEEALVEVPTLMLKGETGFVPTAPVET